MGIVITDLDKLARGHLDHLVVGELPYDVVRRLGWPGQIVYLSRVSYDHIRQTHPDVTRTDLTMASLALSNGLLIHDANRPTHISICYQHPEKVEVRYIMAVKRASKGPDIWMTTFHRSKRRQTISALRRGTVLRKHK
jgi:hypothetical protein